MRLREAMCIHWASERKTKKKVATKGKQDHIWAGEKSAWISEDESQPKRTPAVVLLSGRLSPLHSGLWGHLTKEVSLSPNWDPNTPRTPHQALPQLCFIFLPNTCCSLSSCYTLLRFVHLSAHKSNENSRDFVYFIHCCLPAALAHSRHPINFC